jgi:hypothetical protein
MMRVSLTAPLLAAVTAGLVVRALRLNRLAPAAVEETGPVTAARAAEPPAALAA